VVSFRGMSYHAQYTSEQSTKACASLGFLGWLPYFQAKAKVQYLVESRGNKKAHLQNS
jgi:hypothetical protein